MDIWDKTKRSEVMARVRSKDTKPEIRLRKALFAKGYRYRIHDKKLPGKPDIVLPKYKTVIFVNGCFWHGHKACGGNRVPKSNSEFWSTKIAKNQSRDLKVREQLRLQGWTIATVWECELKNAKLAQTVDIIVQLLENKSPRIITIYEEQDEMIMKVAEKVVKYEEN
ncbi:MAG: DNA mismatch endonuclease Vsr [Bacteroidales bacterium]|jgi:DNA mismatch endonuclease (patch repair protein)|nr:DNA mismatch endonuclease Vsr [Bacteroidales bacterium]